MRRRIWFLLALGSAIAIARVARRWFPVRVAGDSMKPTLRPGELLAVRPPEPDEPTIGQIVVARIGAREVIKRVGSSSAPLPPGTVWLIGDDPTRSTDSRATGPVHRSDIVGIARVRYWPLNRAALLDVKPSRDRPRVRCR